MLQVAVSGYGGADDQFAIFDSLGDLVVLFGFGQQAGGADGRLRFAKCGFVGIHDAQAHDSKIAHGAGGGSDVERVARGYQHYAETVELGLSGQRCLF